MGFANVKPIISVIIPTYNCDRFIKRTLASILQQENCRFEIIVIDCGSSDRTLEILATYSQQIQLLQQQERELAVALNRGISQAEGDLVAFAIADDYFLPNKLASQAAIFVQRNDLGMVDSGWQRMGDDERERLEICPWERLSELNLATWLDRRFLTLSTMMFRREWLQYIGGFNPSFAGAEAWDLVLRLALKGCRSAWLQQVTVGRQNQTTTEETLQLASSLTAVLDNFFSQPDIPSIVKGRENPIRNRQLVWTAWYLDVRGYRAAAINYLKQAWQYRSGSAMTTIINWIESFAGFSEDWGIEFDAGSLTNADEWQQLIRWVMKNTDKTGSN